MRRRPSRCPLHVRRGKPPQRDVDRLTDLRRIPNSHSGSSACRTKPCAGGRGSADEHRKDGSGCTTLREACFEAPTAARAHRPRPRASAVSTSVGTSSGRARASHFLRAGYVSARRTTRAGSAHTECGPSRIKDAVVPSPRSGADYGVQCVVRLSVCRRSASSCWYRRILSRARVSSFHRACALAYLSSLPPSTTGSTLPLPRILAVASATFKAFKKKRRTSG